MDKFFLAIGIAVIGFALAFGLGALFALPVMWLWNALLTGPDSIIGTSLPEIGFMSAWGLSILSSLLFKSSTTTTKS